MGCWVDGWVNMWVNGLGKVIKLKIELNLDLIEIIQFCLKIYDLLDVLDIFLGTFYLNHLSPYGDQMGTNMETTWGQHEDNVETTWGPQGCGDNMGQHCDHRDVETMWGQHGDNMGTT